MHNKTVLAVFTIALNLSYVPILKLSLRYLSLVRNRFKMFSLTKSRSEFGIRSSSSADIFSLVFYLVNHNGCCVFYELPGDPFWSGLCLVSLLAAVFLCS